MRDIQESWKAEFTLSSSEIDNFDFEYLDNLFFPFLFWSRIFSTALPQVDTTGQLFVQTKKGQEVLMEVKHFMKQHILPAEKVFYKQCYVLKDY